MKTHKLIISGIFMDFALLCLCHVEINAADQFDVTGDNVKTPHYISTEDVRLDEDIVYGAVLEAYLEAVSGGDISINNTLFKNSPSASVYYALLDIDGNGIRDLFLANDSMEVVDALTYKNGNLIRLLPENLGYRNYGYLCEDGLLETVGSAGAAYTAIEYYRIREDGRSCEMVELYDMDTDQGITELVDGSVVPCGSDDYSTYFELHGRKTVDWRVLSEENIRNEFDKAGEISESWSARDIIQAPTFRNGVCVNERKLLESYYLRQIRDVREDEVEINYRNDYHYKQDYSTDIQFVEILDAVSKWPYFYLTLNTKTGEVKETQGKEGYLSRICLIDADIMPVTETLWYQPSSLSPQDLYQKYAALVSQYEEKYGKTGTSVIDELRTQVNGLAYLELIDFDNDGTEELLLAYNAMDPSYIPDYRFEIWGASENEIVMKDTGRLYTTDGNIQTLKIGRLNGAACVQSGIGGDFSFEYYHAYDGDGISIISTMYSQEATSGFVYSIDGNLIDKETWDTEWNNRNLGGRAYSLNGTNDTTEITAQISKTKSILQGNMNESTQLEDSLIQTNSLTPEQAEQGLSNYLAYYYPTGRHYASGEQAPDQYEVWAIYPTGAQEKLTVNLISGDVYAEGPYVSSGVPYDEIPVETRYLINVYDYLG